MARNMKCVKTDLQGLSNKGMLMGTMIANYMELCDASLDRKTVSAL